MNVSKTCVPDQAKVHHPKNDWKANVKNDAKDGLKDDNDKIEKGNGRGDERLKDEVVASSSESDVDLPTRNKRQQRNVRSIQDRNPEFVIGSSAKKRKKSLPDTNKSNQPKAKKALVSENKGVNLSKSDCGSKDDKK